MRSFWTIVHRWTGLSIALFIFVAAVTGSVLAFYSEVDGWLNADLMYVEPRHSARLDFETLTRHIEDALPGYTVTGFSQSEMPDRAITASVERPQMLGVTEAFVDPYDGRYLGARRAGEAGLDARRLMPFLYSLHTSLHLPGIWGVWLMGGAAVIWLFDNIIGAYLTLPLRRSGAQARKGWWLRWKPAWQVKTGSSFYRLNFDIHRAAGLWFWALLAVLALSSIYLNLSREVFNPLLSFVARVTPFPVDFPKAQTGGMTISFTAAAVAARESLPASNNDLRLSFIGYDRDTDIFRVGFGYPDAKDEWFNLRQENVFLEGKTGRVAARFGNETATGAGDTFNNLLFPLHSGQIFGIYGRIIICITGFAIALLVVTGVLIWWRKRASRILVRGRR